MPDQKLQKFAQRLQKRFPAQVKLNEPLKNYTTYRVGGPAAALVTPATRQELQQMVRECFREEIPYFILGSGSNILVHDAGLEMIVIRLSECCSEIHHKGNAVYAGAGAPVEALVQFCEENGLAGLEFMSGIPGTVGGALRMNAGAFGGEIGERVTVIEALSGEGEWLGIPAEQAGFGYRRADHLADKILVGCWLELQEGDREALRKTREEILARRAEKQPLEYGSCGSVFKRPTDGFASALIEQAGCKGMTVGGAMVSAKHANFIVNYRNATAQDIFQLIQKVQREVYQKFRVWLEPEVKFVGFPTEEAERVRRPYE